MVGTDQEDNRIMNADWKDVLGAIATGMPQPSAAAEGSVPVTETVKKPVLTLFYEKRRGKPSTIIAGYEESTDESRQLASLLKQRLACGGSERGGEILLQGDVRNRVRTLLTEQGYRVKN